jgi:chorismate synthase
MMTSITGKMTLAVGIAATFLALGAGASAQSDAASRVQARIAAGMQKLVAGCSADVKKFCSTVTDGEGRLFHCLMAYEDQLSEKCDQTLYSAARNLERAIDKIETVADACGSDIEKNCANVPDGRGRVAVCLASKKASLSATCQNAIGGLTAK